MADRDQMTREELLAARKRVTLQIESLAYRGYYTGLGTNFGVRNSKAEIMIELQTILDEINAELAELKRPPPM
jgi:hypothetical protein